MVNWGPLYHFEGHINSNIMRCEVSKLDLREILECFLQYLEKYTIIDSGIESLKYSGRTSYI